MNRIIAIAFATLIPAAASAAPSAPRVDAQKADADRAHVRTLGILGMLQEDGGAAATVLGTREIGAELGRAVGQLRGQSYASTAPAALRTPSAAQSSVSIGAVSVPNERGFELESHRAHRTQVPEAR